MNSLFNFYPQLQNNYYQIQSSITLLYDSFLDNHKLLLCGNGGSNTDALHFAGELLKEFNMKRKFTIHKNAIQYNDYYFYNLQETVSVITLGNEIAFNTAWLNDTINTELLFAQQVLSLGQERDVLFVFSTSGNSKNILHAIQVAKLLKMHTIALTGKSGGKLKNIVDICINVPENETYRIQELHLPIYHYIAQQLEQKLFT